MIHGKLFRKAVPPRPETCKSCKGNTGGEVRVGHNMANSGVDGEVGEEAQLEKMSIFNKLDALFNELMGTKKTTNINAKKYEKLACTVKDFLAADTDNCERVVTLKANEKNAEVKEPVRWKTILK